MTVESNYVIAIATLGDWVKRLAPVFQPTEWEAKAKPIAPCTRDFSRASSELQVIARNCDWFIALPAPVVIGRSNCLVLDFQQLFENRSMVVIGSLSTCLIPTFFLYLGCVFTRPISKWPAWLQSITIQYLRFVQLTIWLSNLTVPN